MCRLVKQLVDFCPTGSTAVGKQWHHVTTRGSTEPQKHLIHCFQGWALPFCFYFPHPLSLSNNPETLFRTQARPISTDLCKDEENIVGSPLFPLLQTFPKNTLQDDWHRGGILWGAEGTLQSLSLLSDLPPELKRLVSENTCFGQWFK